MRRTLIILLICFLAMVVIDAKPVHATSNIIYGHSISSASLPDATIKQVSFSRDGDNLVTSLQVYGHISGLYSYQIAIVTSPFLFSKGYTQGIYDIRFIESSYNIYTTPTNVSFPKSRSLIKSSTSSDNEQFTISGDTWTAWTPLSRIGFKTHFWVWVGVGPQIYFWSAGWFTRPSGLWTSLLPWVDFLPSPQTSSLNNEIELPAKVTFTLQPNSLASKATLTIDGSPHNFNSSGSLSVTVDSGVSHPMTITSPIQTSDDTRYVVSWANAYYNADNSIALNVDEDSSRVISFQRQFLLTVKSDLGNVSGGGWYNEGSTASFSVSPVQLPYDGFLGTLNLQHQFTGWSGNAADTITSSLVSMNGPKTVTANWKTTGGPLFLGLVGIVVGSLLVAAFLLYRKHGLRKSNGIK
jgi:hypothetical protein